MSGSLQRVFVYGTLKAGFPNHGLLQDQNNGIAKLLFNAVTVQKYPLVVASSSSIPFLLDKPGFGNNIVGEIYEVDKKMMVVLDKLEDVDVLYSRLKINVKQSQSSNDEEIDVNAYVLQSFKDKLLDLPFLKNYAMENTKDYIKGIDRPDEFHTATEVKNT